MKVMMLTDFNKCAFFICPVTATAKYYSLISLNQFNDARIWDNTAPLDSYQKCDYGGGSWYCKNIAKDTMQYFTIFFPPGLNMTHRSTIRGWSIQVGHNLNLNCSTCWSKLGMKLSTHSISLQNSPRYPVSRAWRDHGTWPVPNFFSSTRPVPTRKLKMPVYRIIKFHL